MEALDDDENIFMILDRTQPWISTNFHQLKAKVFAGGTPATFGVEDVYCIVKNAHVAVEEGRHEFCFLPFLSPEKARILVAEKKLFHRKGVRTLKGRLLLCMLAVTAPYWPSLGALIRLASPPGMASLGAFNQTGHPGGVAKSELLGIRYRGLSSFELPNLLGASLCFPHPTSTSPTIRPHPRSPSFQHETRGNQSVVLVADHSSSSSSSSSSCHSIQPPPHRSS
jgi:hypothetical protein